MIQKNNKQKLKEILDILNYMCYEVNIFIGKNILLENDENKYASRYNMTPDMKIKFYLYNSETETTACKEYDFIEFADICSHKEKMIAHFTRITEDLLMACDKKSEKIIYI